jgi:hypothetical protein
MSYGAKAVGLDFNPSGNPQVQKLKELYAEIIDTLHELGQSLPRGEQARLLSIAITEAQGAQMWAVKGVTFKD